MSRPRPLGIESKAEAIRTALSSPHLAKWNRKSIRDFAICDWKARRQNHWRPHPSEAYEWKDWLNITNERYERRLRRAGVQ